jgi:hypothetical protein
MNDEAKEIMSKIASVIGGYYVPDDCRDTGEMIDGMVFEGDGIPYFVKHAMITNQMTDNDDMAGLQAAIKAWNKKHK